MLVVCGGAIACTCEALDLDVGHVLHTILHRVGMDGESEPPVIKGTIVTAGNQLSVSGSRMKIDKISAGDMAQRLSWAGIYQKDGWLIFRGETLDKVIAEFNRHNKRQLRLGDPRTGRLQVGGKFRVTDVDGFVAALGESHGVKSRHLQPRGGDTDVIVLSGGSASPDGREVVSPPVEPID